MAGGAGSAYPSCPLTPEDVAAVTGTAMDQDENICQFHAADEQLLITILFVKQSSVLDGDDVREELGYDTSEPGIGDEAYSGPDDATGTQIAVKDGRQWFEVTANNVRDPSTELDWAKQLATFIADNN